MNSAESYSVSQQESNDDLQKSSKNADITFSFVLFFASFYSVSHNSMFHRQQLAEQNEMTQIILIRRRRNSFHDLKGNPSISCSLRMIIIVLTINAKKYINYIFSDSKGKVSMYHNTINICISVDILLFNTFHHIPLISKMSTSL